MENNKMTAVEWFAMITKELGYVSEAQLEQALEIEKEQIIEAHDSKFKVMDEKFENGGLTVEYQSGLGYYNEKYGQK